MKAIPTKRYLSILLIFVLQANTYVHRCKGPIEPARITIRSTRTTVVGVSSIQSNLRIGLHYTNALLASSNAAQLKQKIIEPAVKYWSEALAAKRPLTSNFLMQRECVGGLQRFITDFNGKITYYCTNGCSPTTICGTVPVPEQYLDKCYEVINGQEQSTGTAGSGIENIDTLIFIDATQTTHCTPGTLAYATICQSEDTLNRPIAGYINLCASSIQLQEPGLTTSYYTVLHELAHSLGFHSAMYAYMRDEYGQPRTPRSTETGQPINILDGLYVPSTSTIGSSTLNWTTAKGTFARNIQLLKTPHVLAMAQEHFNCPSMQGVELENQGSVGTLVTHFEERLLFDELMTGVIDGAAIVSKITLGFFEDTGWYTVNYSKAETFNWGKNLGCNFVEKSCFEYAQNQIKNGQSTLPWCDILGSASPGSVQQSAIDACRLATYSTDLPTFYQYFTALKDVSSTYVPRTGGHNSLADYCPVSKIYAPKNTAGLIYRFSPEFVGIIFLHYFIMHIYF